MTICFVEWGYPGKRSGGGAGTYIQLLGQELVRRGNKVFVISPYLQGEPEESSDKGVIIKRVRIGGRHWYFTKIPIIGAVLAKFCKIIEASLAINAALKKLHKEHVLDLVEFPESTDFLYKMQVGLPCVVHLHGSSVTLKKYCNEPIFLEDRLQRRLEGIFIKGADFVTSPSKFLLGEVIREFKVDASKTRVIPYPIDEKLLDIPPKSGEGAKVVFYAGRLEERKGVHTLKEAIPLVTTRCADVRFLFFGSDSYRINRETLMEYFRKFKVSDRVEVHSFTPKETLFEYLAKADICVIPSVWDNSPNTVYEAMAMGKPVVATDVGGIPELVSDGVTGILVKPNDKASLSDAIVSLLKDSAKVKMMGEKARETAAKRFALANIVEERLKIYQMLGSNSNT